MTEATETTGTATQTATETKKKAVAKKAAPKTAAKKAAAKKAAPKKAAAKKGGVKAHGADSMASKIRAMLERKGGVTMKEMRKVAPNSAGSLLFALRKGGMKINVTKDEEGTRTYAAK